MDHQNLSSGVCAPPIQSATNHLNETLPGELNDGAKSQSNQLQSVPLGENENFLLDMVYKCLRGKGVRVINSNYANNNNISNSNSGTAASNKTSSSSSDSNRIREKENAIENHWSDDEILTEPVKAVANNPILPTVPRFASSKCAYVPRAIASNHFNMARGRGTCHVKHTVDYTKKIQQQIFHRIQTQQHNGTFTNANMITLRNNGLLRLNSANLNISNIGTITTASINTGTNSSVNTIKTTVAATTVGTAAGAAAAAASPASAATSATTAMTVSAPGAVAGTVTATPINAPTSIATVINANNSTNNTSINASANTNTNTNASANANASPTTTATPTTPTTAAKLAFKKPVHFVNSIATTTNGPIVLLNPGNAATMSSAPGNPRYAIFRRPMAQSSIQFIARPTIDPSNSYSLMPAIHRVKARAFKPNVPKFLETDRLIESLKSIIRPQTIDHNTYNLAKKVLSVHNQSLIKVLASQQQNHHSNISTNNNMSSSSLSSSSSRRKSHSSSMSNHKSQPMITPSSQKQNGHSQNGMPTSGSNYIASSNSNSNTTNHIDKRTHLRVANDTNHK